MSAAKQLALMAGIPVKHKADGSEFVVVSKATANYLFGAHQAYLAPLLCRCPQRDHPHEISVHSLIRSEWWKRELWDRWPWSLMQSRREEPSTERSAA
jgi:hypothetical protein